MGIKEVKAYRTSDGGLYSTEKEADFQQSVLDLREVIEEDPLFGSFEGSEVETCALLGWLKTHKSAVERYLKNVR